jgi:phosphatidate cytidylyltransferase
LAYKEFIKRSISGILFASILIFAAQNRITFLALILIFGLITLLEFNRLIKQKNPFSYLIFILIFFVFGLLDLIIKIPAIIIH